VDLAKKRKVIKRVYESGRETTVTSKPTRLKAKKQSKTALKKPTRLKAKKQSKTAVKKPPRRPSQKIATASKRPKSRKKPKPAPKTDRLKNSISKTKEKPIYRQEPPLSELIHKIPDINSFKENIELPSTYNLTHLTLLVKDPYWLHAYWDITPEDLESAKQQLPLDERQRFTIVLRVYDITLKDFDGYNANYYFDLDVGFDASNWYINLWNDGTSYTADLGLKTVSGKFVHISRANVVHTPRMNHSPRSEQIWMHLAENDNGTAYVNYRQKLKTRRASKGQDAPGAYRRRIYLSDDDIRRYYSALSPLLSDVIAQRLSKGFSRRDGEYSLTIEEGSPQERELLLNNLPENFFVKRIIKGASESLVVLADRGNVHEAGSFASSEFLQQKLSNRTFFFEIWTELLVYGRTLPDAMVSLGTKNIPLKSDGTFSLRFSLADQTIHLPFKAESADRQDSRAITTEVERRTQYI
jgi:hypothetical protein